MCGCVGGYRGLLGNVRGGNRIRLEYVGSVNGVG